MFLRVVRFDTLKSIDIICACELAETQIEIEKTHQAFKFLEELETEHIKEDTEKGSGRY